RHIDVVRINVDRKTDPLGELSGDERCSGTEKGVVYDFACARVIENRPAHQLQRFLCAVSCGFLIPITSKGIEVGNFPQRGLLSITGPVRAFALAHGVPAGLMLPVIIAPPDREMLLSPDDLGADDESRSSESSGLRRCGRRRATGMRPCPGNDGTLPSNPLDRRWRLCRFDVDCRGRPPRAT